jgi:hypothetical protein
MESRSHSHSDVNALQTNPTGIEVTTGPLGQGFGNGVGLALAQAHLAAVYNKDGFNLINNFTYGKIIGCRICFMLLKKSPPKYFVVMAVSWRVFLVKLRVSQAICSSETS